MLRRVVVMLRPVVLTSCSGDETADTTTVCGTCVERVAA
jgi:hypothetical protein